MKRTANVILALLLLSLLVPFGAQAQPLEQGTGGAITSPVDGQTLRGAVTITGSAAGAQFDYYKVEYRPEGVAEDAPWTLVGDDVRRNQVTDGVLDTWDTTRVPDGVYALRLRVVDVTGNYQEMTVGKLLVQNAVTPTPVAPVATPTPAVAAAPGALTPEESVTQLAGLNEIVGAVYDPDNGAILLIGRANPELPPLRPDDWVTALRAIYSGEFPAVSIDPGPDNSVMNVRYFGRAENTHFGWVMFEADRMLKIYSMGVDNLNGQPVKSAVAGYQSELELSTPPQREDTMPLWHRMWFEPAGENGSLVTISGDRRAILFDTANMVVKTEYVSVAGSPKPEGSDPAAEKFVAHFNQHLAEFAAERPALHNLTQLQRYIIIARWLRDQGVPVDMLWVRDWPVAEAETPATTPRVSASRTFAAFVLMIGGGVDLSLENQYQVDNARTAELLKAIQALPSVQGMRSGPLEFEGNAYQTISFPLRRASYFQRKDARGRTWIIDRETGRLLALIDEAGNVTNFDQYDDQHLLQKTSALPQNTVRFAYADSLLSSVTYASKETMRTDLPSLLAALQAVPSTEAPPQTAYEYLAQNKMLAPPAWVSLPTASGAEVSVWPVEAAGEQFVVVLGDQASLTVPADDIVTKFDLDGKQAQIVSGQAAFDLRQRRLAATLGTKDTLVAYPYEEDGEITLQVGKQRLPLGLSADELAGIVPGDPEWAELSRGLEELAADSEPDAELIIFAGQGFSDTPEGETMKRERQAVTEKLALVLRRQGVSASTGNGIEKAQANLNSQQPLVDKQGKWNVEVIVDAGSLANLSDAGRKHIEQIQNQAKTAGIPHYTAWDALTGTGNIVFVTAHNSQDLRRTLSGLGKETLRGKYLVLAVCGEADAEVVNHDFIRDVLIDEYGATGVLLPQHRITPRAAQILFEELVKLRKTSPELKAHAAVNQAVQNALRRDDLSEPDKAELKALSEHQSFISLLGPDLEEPLGLG